MEYFSNLIEYYDELYAVTKEQKEFYENLQKNFIVPTTFLRIGCGTGAFEHYLSKNGHDVTGIETVKDMIEVATRRRRFPHMAIRFFQMSTTEMTKFLGKNFYNIISCLDDRILFLKDKDMQRKFFQDCKMLLSEKGFLVLGLSNYDLLATQDSLTLPTKESIRSKLFTRVLTRDKNAFLFQDVETSSGKVLPVIRSAKVCPLTAQEIQELAYESGFSSVEFYENFSKNPFSQESKTLVCVIR
ncbi:MAG: methyltransferase domain-containing protein [Spirochaetaceae bacterium]|nr:methyltransferase domain-containing protein [Spirochaetaceae bacterium]